MHTGIIKSGEKPGRGLSRCRFLLISLAWRDAEKSAADKSREMTKRNEADICIDAAASGESIMHHERLLPSSKR